MRYGSRWRDVLTALPLLIGLGAAACTVPEDEPREPEARPSLTAAQINTEPTAVPPPEDPSIDSSQNALPSFPYVVEPACPGEGCMYDEWLACAAVPVYANMGGATESITTLDANERFSVLTGAVVVESPGIVAITRPSRPVPFLEGEDIFQPGDTLYVLEYLAEGFFNTWFQGSFFETAQFWPGPNLFPSSSYEFGGSVVQEVESSFWVRIRSADQGEGWVDASNATLAAPNALDPDPAACR